MLVDIDRNWSRVRYDGDGYRSACDRKKNEGIQIARRDYRHHIRSHARTQYFSKARHGSATIGVVEPDGLTPRKVCFEIEARIIFIHN